MLYNPDADQQNEKTKTKFTDQQNLERKKSQTDNTTSTKTEILDK